jgi:hypothetical protein
VTQSVHLPYGKRGPNPITGWHRRDPQVPVLHVQCFSPLALDHGLLTACIIYSSVEAFAFCRHYWLRSCLPRPWQRRDRENSFQEKVRYKVDVTMWTGVIISQLALLQPSARQKLQIEFIFCYFFIFFRCFFISDGCSKDFLPLMDRIAFVASLHGSLAGYDGRVLQVLNRGKTCNRTEGTSSAPRQSPLL